MIKGLQSSFTKFLESACNVESILCVASLMKKGELPNREDLALALARVYTHPTESGVASNGYVRDSGVLLKWFGYPYHEVFRGDPKDCKIDFTYCVGIVHDVHKVVCKKTQKGIEVYYDGIYDQPSEIKEIRVYA